ALEADIDTYTARSSVQSESDNIVHTYYHTNEPSSDLNFMHNLEAHSSGVIFTAMQQYSTSEPKIATTSGSDKPYFVTQQLTYPQPEKVLVSDTAVLSDTTISQQQQQQPEQTSVSEAIPIQPDTDIITTNIAPPINGTVEVMPTQQVVTVIISEPEPKLKEVISSELSVPEEEEEILHFDIRNTTPDIFKIRCQETMNIEMETPDVSIAEPTPTNEEQKKGWRKALQRVGSWLSYT
ncbi:hypothetical protein A2U01_0000673, partial [Trifolium medium]|nr:hypothetical protein [Trifolium medium]